MTAINLAVQSFLGDNAHIWSPQTVRTYGTALNCFLAYLRDRKNIPSSSPTLLLANPDLISGYPEHLATLPSGLSELTYRLYLTALLRFINYLFMTDELGQVSATEFQRITMQLRAAQRPSLKSTSLRPEQRREPPSAELIDRLIRLAKTEFPAPDADERTRCQDERRRLRNVALLEFLRSSGARISEALALSQGDVMSDNTALLGRGEGKGNKGGFLYFDVRTAHALRTYRMALGTPPSSAPLFMRHDRGAGDKVKPLSAAGAQAEIRRLRARLVADLRAELVRLLLPDLSDEAVAAMVAAMEQAEDGDWFAPLADAQRLRPDLVDDVAALRAEVEEARRITAHSFRHYFASLLLEQTGDLAAVQDLMRHSRPDTTRRYARLSEFSTLIIPQFN